ncbi:hypothetical protein [Paraburkholderia domus]|uniref:hypothetical protein n=1 Tax=Paraburkholderia domus TaxID=2793075 RepID=UPI0019142041|nr:hypothetical protein [Paraburkholderia domus]MBK5065758.1 hypothetical protein [Burkholderia sp. R-70199]CAE6962766.1 hypothetical protein R70199_07445 [Paraburkholderia domus]
MKLKPSLDELRFTGEEPPRRRPAQPKGQSISTSLAWGRDLIYVRDSALAARIENEARVSAAQPRVGKWDYPFSSLAHTDHGASPGVVRPIPQEAADQTLRLFLGIETPCALCMVGPLGDKRAMVATGVRLTPVRGGHSERRRTWLFTGYFMYSTGHLGDGITGTAVASDEDVLVRGLDAQWRPVRPLGTPDNEPAGVRFVYSGHELTLDAMTMETRK